MVDSGVRFEQNVNCPFFGHTEIAVRDGADFPATAEKRILPDLVHQDEVLSSNARNRASSLTSFGTIRRIIVVYRTFGDVFLCFGDKII